MIVKRNRLFLFKKINLLLLSLLISFIILSACISQASNLETDEIDHHIYVGGTLNQGETLAQALQNKGLGYSTFTPLLNQLNSVYNLRRCQPADSFLVKLDTLNVIHQLSYFPVREKIITYSVLRDSSGTYYPQVDTLKTEKVLRKVDTAISGSLYSSLRVLGEGPHLIVNFAEIFQWDFDFFLDTREGDRIAFVYEQYMLNGEFVQYGNILVAEYNGANYRNRAYRYVNNEGLAKYYNKEGKSFQKAFLRSPLNYTRISSRFSTGRYHPILKIVRPHNGVDYAAPTGTPVVAAADGIVSHVGWKGGHPTVNGMSGGYGRTVMIRHSNGYETLYGHLNGYAQGIRKGVRVTQNQVIGYVGQTGLATGPHLHYTVYLNNVAIDPLRMNNEPGPPVPKSEMDKFKSLTEKLDNYIGHPVDYFLNYVLN
ncbi:MAG: M23 family metallopeptidase [Candidatus Cloacimonetes bacterium]|nr:M23 family metallopeptidase [Candidatus Cloacimonadota bacterium]